MEIKNKKVLYYGLGALVVLALVLFLSMRNDKDADLEGEQSVNESEEMESEEGKEESKKTPAKSEPVLSYAEALAKYKDARIQLDDRCQASPNNVTYKNNTSIMIDNRSPMTRSVKVGSTYTIKGYGFKIVKLSSSQLPIQWLVDCDKSQNVATILIQK